MSYERPFQAHSDTSREAAVAMKPTAENLRAEVLRFLTERGEHGATDEEVQLALDMAGNTQRPRRRELELMDQVVNSGKTRPTQTGRSAVVWAAKVTA